MATHSLLDLCKDIIKPYVDSLKETLTTKASTTDLQTEASTRSSADGLLQTQIDELVAPSGEAPSAAEVQNARIGANGVTYSTLGNAIRSQLTDVNNILNYNGFTVKKFTVLANTTHSSASDQVLIEIPAGEQFFVDVKFSSAEEFQLIAIKDDNTTSSIATVGTATTHYTNIFKNNNDNYKAFGIYFATDSLNVSCEVTVIKYNSEALNKIGEYSCFVNANGKAEYYTDGGVFFTTSNQINIVINGTTYTINNTQAVSQLGSTYAEVSGTNGILFKIPYNYALAFNLITSQLVVRDNEKLYPEDYPLIVSNYGGICGGALAEYYLIRNAKTLNETVQNLLVGNVVLTKTFSIAGNTTHSSASDQLDVNIKHGQEYAILTTKGTPFAFYTDNTSGSIPKTGVASKDIAKIGIYTANHSSAAITVEFSVITSDAGIQFFDSTWQNVVSEKFLQAKRPINIGANGYLSELSPFTLFHFSDIHGDVTELKNLIKYIVRYNADDAICTGDIVEDRYADDYTFWTNTDGAADILLAIGNHDVLSAATGYDWDQRASQSDQYTKFFAPVVSNWNVTITSGKTYYYKDYAAKKIRLIVLNTMLTGADDAEQLSWLETTLASALANGYNVIIANHCMIESAEKIACNFTTLDYTVSDGFFILPTSYMDKVDDFITAGGNFICHIAGHTHNDFVVHNPNYPNQICVVIGCASRSLGNVHSDTQRTDYTRSMDLANLLTVDTSCNTVKIIRVGANVDHYIRMKDSVTFNYVTREIISES